MGFLVGCRRVGVPVPEGKRPRLPWGAPAAYHGAMEHKVSANPALVHFGVSQPTVTVTSAKPPSPPWYRYGINMARAIDWDQVFEVVQNILSDLEKYLRARGPVPREKWVHRPTPRPSTSLRPDKARW